MQIQSTLKSSSTPVAVGTLRWAAWATAAVAALGAAASLMQAEPADASLTQQVAAFQQRVTGSSASSASPTAQLAQRYLGALQPEQRQRIGEQVREEQRAGVTPEGNTAFVMRRLALYEAALQQAGVLPAPPVR